MRRRHIVRLGRIRREIKQLERHRLLDIRRLASLVAARLAVERARLARQAQFPVAHANRLEVVVVVVEEERVVRRFGVGGATPHRLRVATVDGARSRGGGRADDRSHGGEKIDRHPRHIAHLGRRNMARPTHDARLAHAAFESCALALAQATAASRVGTERQPRPVVAGKHHDRVAGGACFIERLEHFAHRPVNLAHHRSVKLAAFLGREILAGRDRRVRLWMGDVCKKRLVLRGFRADKRHGSSREFAGHQPLILHGANELDGLGGVHQRQLGKVLAPKSLRPHVV